MKLYKMHFDYFSCYLDDEREMGRLRSYLILNTWLVIGFARVNIGVAIARASGVGFDCRLRLSVIGSGFSQEEPEVGISCYMGFKHSKQT